jgi:hypothetical protein
MKLTSLLAALGLIACGAALAAEPPPAPSATPVKHASLKTCNKEATDKKLTGKERAQFVKDCRAGKTSG